MRLAFCNATHGWGGVKTWTIETAAALAAKGHTLTLYGRPGPFIERAKSLGLDAVAVDFGPDFNPLAIAFFLREFRRRAVDAVLVNVGRDLRTAGVAARMAGLPLVQRIGLPRDMRNTLKVRLLHRLLRPRYLCPCYYIRDGLLEAVPCIQPEDTHVVHTPKAPLATPPETMDSPLRIATTSQLNPNKGHEELLYALARLRDRGFDFIWEVAGTGDSAEQLRTLADALGLGDKVVWHGFTQNVGAVLRASDIFVLPSYTEGLPNTLLEAMAHGLVPLARNVGGIGEIWPESLKHLLVPDQPRDGSVLEAALAGILSAPPGTLRSWKREAWQACRDGFSPETQIPKLEAFFQECIG